MSSMKRTPIEMDHVKSTCKIGAGHACCRYLGGDKDGLACLKGGEFHALLDKRVEEKTITARGDNCPGWDRWEINLT